MWVFLFHNFQIKFTDPSFLANGIKINAWILQNDNFCLQSNSQIQSFTFLIDFRNPILDFRKSIYLYSGNQRLRSNLIFQMMTRRQGCYQWDTIYQIPMASIMVWYAICALQTKNFWYEIFPLKWFMLRIISRYWKARIFLWCFFFKFDTFCHKFDTFSHKFDTFCHIYIIIHGLVLESTISTCIKYFKFFVCQLLPMVAALH
jgi:hypothetical protein